MILAHIALEVTDLLPGREISDWGRGGQLWKVELLLVAADLVVVLEKLVGYDLLG